MPFRGKLLLSISSSKPKEDTKAPKPKDDKKGEDQGTMDADPDQAIWGKMGSSQLNRSEKSTMLLADLKEAKPFSAFLSDFGALFKASRFSLSVNKADQF